MKYKQRRVVLLVLTLVLALAGCSSGADAQKISAEEAKSMMDQGGVIILDVRTQEEFDQGHIRDAILLPDDQILEKAESLLSDKEATILVYCRSGNRSAQARKALIDLGYTKVYDFGGIINWPYELVK